MEKVDDIKLVSSLLSTMFETGCDFTNGFRSLSLFTRSEESWDACMNALIAECCSVQELMQSYRPQIPPG